MVSITRSNQSKILDSIMKNAVDFGSREEMNEYMKEHPGADPKNHKVVEKKEKIEPEKKEEFKKKIEDKKKELSPQQSYTENTLSKHYNEYIDNNYNDNDLSEEGNAKLNHEVMNDFRNNKIKNQNDLQDSIRTHFKRFEGQ